MASNTYGAIKLTTAEDVGAALKKKTGSADGYKPKEWADTINLMGLLPIRTASGSIAHFTDGADAVPFKSLTAQILPIQSGTGTPSPSNPRPISGTSVSNVTRAGNNIFDISQFATLYPSYCTYENDVLNVQGSTILYTKGVEVKAPAGAKLSATITDITSVNARFRLYYTDGTYSDVYPNQLPFSLLKDLASVRLNWSTNGTFKIENAQIEIDSTATTYEPYTGSTYTVDLGRTIYGGSVDVVGGVGEKTFNEPLKLSSGWLLQGTGTDGGAVFYHTTSDKKANAIGFCEKLEAISNGGWSATRKGTINFGHGSGLIFVSIDGLTTSADVNAFMSDCEFCYELATPESFTFNGVTVESLEGVNNVWTNSGDVSVEYRADINLLISELGG